jgi:hypothetical protein
MQSARLFVLVSNEEKNAVAEATAFTAHQGKADE